MAASDLILLPDLIPPLPPHCLDQLVFAPVHIPTCTGTSEMAQAILPVPLSSALLQCVLWHVCASTAVIAPIHRVLRTVL